MKGGRTVMSDDEDEINDEEEDREPADGEDIADREDDDEEDEEDEEGQDEYEKDGFIVDDVEEEEDEEENEEERHRKRKKKKRESEKNYVLDEDDYELLQDNNVGFRRPKTDAARKFKRLKKAGRDEQGEPSGFSDDDEMDRRGRGGQENLKRSLFGGDEGQNLDDIGDEIGEEEEPPEEEEDVDMDDENEMADFIVDEEEVDENGAPVRRRKMKKKKSRQAPGVSSSALQEAHDIFGDVDDLLTMRMQSLARSNAPTEKRLEDEFEPFILSHNYMSKEDEQVRNTDLPERIQLLEESTGPAPTDESSIEEEGAWIHNQLITNFKPLLIKNPGDLVPNELSMNIKEDIVRFLQLFHVDKFDIPFIATYRKESCPTLLEDLEQDAEIGNVEEDTPTLKWHKLLWVIKDLIKKWLLLQKRKSALQLHYSKRFEEESRRIYDDELRLNLNQKIFESIIESLKIAESEREVDDVDSKFNLHFPPGEIGVEEGQFKRPKRKSLYSICSKAGLWDVANKIGYTSERLGMNIALEKMEYGLEDIKEPPEDVASNFTCAMFETPQAVLKGARHMAAVEISCEPRVRKHVRDAFMKDAVVSTSPTPAGNSAIDSFHQFAGIKWLRNKPVEKFKDGQWLLIQKAEEEKLLQVTVNLPQEPLNKLLTDFKDNYLSDGVSAYSKVWNEQRNLILQDAVFNFIIPSMEKEVRSLLTSKAKHFVLMEYGKRLWNKVSVAPYQRKENDGPDDDAAPKVMACCWGPGKPATTFVILDSSGEVLDVLYTGSLNVRSQNVNDQQRKKNDQQRVLKFITDHQPHICVLGAVNMSCAKLKDELFEIIFKMVEENPRDIGHGMDDLNVVYGDESLPRLYENSRVSSDQVPGHAGIVKRAAALGRYLQNPLAMVATLCGPEREILSWKFGALDHFLTPDEKYEMVEQVMVDVTNQVGIDINLAASHEWLFSPLQFVSGLGPRKAASLQKALVRKGYITTRRDLLGEFMKRRIFVNAAGFLRIRRSGLVNSGQFVDVLDDSRIHPESYELAKHMALDVYKEDAPDEVNDDDDLYELAIEHVRERPLLLKALLIDEYIKDKDLYSKRDTLQDIKLELVKGFRDRRPPFREADQNEEFYMISGETEDTLAEGRIVQVTVRRPQAQRVFCALESGLSGLLSIEDYSDHQRPNDLTEVLNEGDILTCKIKSIQKNRYLVYLTCKESELKGDKYQNFGNRDFYYQPDDSNLQSEQEKARKEKELAKKHFKPRMIVHPRFQNITADEAVELLSDKEAGESIIRPSSRGPSFLTLTLKVYDGVYAHKDIVEGGKDHKDITSLLRLGKTLKIGEDTFEDLDEVMDRYVDPLVAHLKAMLSYRKFKQGSKAEVDDLLKIEKSEYPMRIVYCFGISHEHPGTFILSYIRSTNPHHEYIGLYPKGFKFRKRTFEDIDRLVAYFQRHIDDLQNDSGPSIRSVAAMVPMKSPAGGGSSGASIGSAWGGSAANDDDGSWRGQGNFDRERSSTPGSRTGRNDFGSGGHPSGLPRPYGGRGRDGGRGRGRGRGRGNDGSTEGQDSGFGGSSNWSSGSKDGDDGWGSFPGAKVQNSPGREAFPGGWGSGNTGSFPGAKTQNSPGREAFPGGWGGSGSGSGGGGGGGWGGSGNGGGNDGENGGGGWGSGGGGGGWGSGGGGNAGSESGNGGSGWSSGAGGRGGFRDRGRGGGGRGEGGDRGRGRGGFRGRGRGGGRGRSSGGGEDTGGGWGSGWGPGSGEVGGGSGGGWSSTGDGGRGNGAGDWNSSVVKDSGTADTGSDNSAWGGSKKKTGTDGSGSGWGGGGGW